MRFQELISYMVAEKTGSSSFCVCVCAWNEFYDVVRAALTEEPMRGSFPAGAFEIMREKLTAGVSADESGKC